MAAELGGSQISALLESVPGIANVLRSPVADAIVSLVRAGAGLHPFAVRDAEELVSFAVRRGLINAAEGDQVLTEVRGAKKGRPRPPAKPKTRPAKATPQKPAAKKPTAKKPAAKKPTAKKPAAKKPAAKAATAKKKPAKKAVKRAAAKPAKKAAKPAKKTNKKSTPTRARR